MSFKYEMEKMLQCQQTHSQVLPLYAQFCIDAFLVVQSVTTLKDMVMITQL